ncbi:MAG: chemotaxis protein CheW, partial [Woeseiaceae bacterium]
MTESPDLKALVEQPFDLLKEIEARSRAAVAGKGSGSMPSEWVGIGFRIGQEQFVANRNQVREVLMLPDAMTRVPGARRWVLGIANLRGHLLPLIDVKMMFGSGRT